MDFRQITKKLHNEFAIKKINAERKASKNVAWLNSIPEFATLAQVERELALKISKLKNAGTPCKELQETLALVRDKKKKILEKTGLKPEDLKPKYECKKCSDFGFVNGRMCSCFKKRKNEELIKSFGIEISKQKTFKNYNTKICKNESQAKSLEKLKTVLENWVESYPNIKKRNIFISGQTGVGKSYLTECLANSLLNKGYSVCFVSAFELNNSCLKYHTSFDADKYSWIEPFIESDFLIIDDLGTEPKLKNVTTNYLHLILSERERYMRPVIITTNLMPSDIGSQYDERIYSRLVNKQSGVILNLCGDDLRVSV